MTFSTMPEITVDKYDQKLPTIGELRKAIPKECFEKNTALGIAFLVWDLIVIAALYKVEPYFEMAGLPGMMFWYFIMGLMGAAVFVVGHDCGHGCLSDTPWVNDLVGHFVHGILFVPFWPWQHSHRLHHIHTSHVDKDKGHVWITEAKYAGLGPGRRFYAHNPSTAFIKWPFYLILGVNDGSHFWPRSMLFTNNVDRIKCVFSGAVCVAFATAAYWYLGSFGAFVKFYVLPVMAHGFWVIMITYLQHQNDDIHVFEDGTWTFMKGQLQTIDRSYGFGIDAVLHHVTDGHVAHHLFFTSIPHYHLPRATEAVAKMLEPYGVYRREASHDFLFRFASLNRRLIYLIGAGTGHLQYAKMKDID